LTASAIAFAARSIQRRVTSAHGAPARARFLAAPTVVRGRSLSASPSHKNRVVFASLPAISVAAGSHFGCTNNYRLYILLKRKIDFGLVALRQSHQ
jgi:hypothetical protein